MPQSTTRQPVRLFELVYRNAYGDVVSREQFEGTDSQANRRAYDRCAAFGVSRYSVLETR